MVARAATRLFRPRLLPPPRRRIISPEEEWAVHGVAERRAGPQEKAKMVDRSTNTTTSAPHRSHAVAGWSQAAGTPHDPLLQRHRLCVTAPKGSGGAAGDEPR